MSKRQGTVKFFNETKGYGFITCTDTGTEIFVHATGLSEEVKKGDVVNFEIGVGKRGDLATNVSIA